MPIVDSANVGDSQPGFDVSVPPAVFGPDSDKPWLARKDWASGELCYHAGIAPGIFVGFLGLILLCLAFPFAAALPQSIQTNGYYAFIPLLILGSLGFAVMVQAVRLMIGGIKTGRVVFHLDSVPVPLGGPLRGQLKMSKPIPARQSVRLTLKCTSFSEMRGRPNRDTISSSRVVSEYSQTVVSDGTGIIPVSMVTTASAPPSKLQPKKWPSHDATATISWVEWQFSADDPSGRTEDRHAAFVLPVFKVGEIPQPVVDLEAIRAARTVELGSYQPGSDFNVRITPLIEGGTEFYFPPVRGAANAVSQTVVFLIMAAILAGVSGPLSNKLNADINHSGDRLVVALYAGWAILTLLLFLWVLRLWFAPERVTIGNGMVSHTSGLFGKTRRMRVSEIAAIHAVAGMYTKNSAIRIRGSGWNMLTVGDGIRDRRDAEWLAMQISRAAGIKPVASLPSDDAADQLQVMQAFLEKIGSAQKSPISAGDADRASSSAAPDPRG
jgi:hypothetical protein